MPKEFVNPNLHVILIHYPLALLTLGTFIELFSFLWRRSSFRAAGRWMILLGALSLVPASTLGLYAMADVNGRHAAAEDASWEAVRAESPVKEHAWEMMTEHAWFSAIGSGVILLLVVSYLAASDIFRRRAHLLYLLLLLGGLGAILSGAWHGGEMIYRHGVAVDTSGESAEGESESPAKHGITYYAPPMQVHVMLAGFAVSLGLAAIGLSFRAGIPVMTNAQSPVPLTDQYGYALNPSLRPPDPTTTAAQLHYPDPATQVPYPPPPRQPVSRFWVLGALIGLLTAGTGWWVLAHSADTWDPSALWLMVKEDVDLGNTRRMAHVAVGVGMVVMMFLLAIIARAAAGRRFVIALFVLAFLGLASAQVWLGSLLMFDTPLGSLWKFNSEAAAATTEPTEPVTVDGPTTAPTTAPATTTSTAPVANTN